MKERDYYRPHHVYLVGNKELNCYKIGLAMNIDRRMRGFSLPFEVELITKVTLDDRGRALTVEQNLHRLYANVNLRGEWFHDIDPKTFVFYAEYIAADRYDLAQQEYRETRVGVGSGSEDQDRKVLAALKQKGLDAARQVRGR